MTLALLLLPTLAGAVAFFVLSHRLRRALLVLTAVAHAALTAAAWHARPAPAIEGWLGLDAQGLLFLAVTSVVFLAAAVYAVGYLAREHPFARRDHFEPGVYFSNVPEGVFTGCLLLFLASMTLVATSLHFGLLWVGIEATTIASAPLIYFHRHHRSLEATWKYLMICSVGIALALIGNFLLTVAASDRGGHHVPLTLAALTRAGHAFDATWLRAAIVFFAVGYGTKMGLAPMHTWLPDAHSESPSLVSALLSGAVLNCSFLGILRMHTVAVAAGQGELSRSLLLGLGLFSIACAGVFVLRQPDYKRLLAYSSVEHMGIVAFGVGLGVAGGAGAMLHAVNHSVTKGMLFLVAGNILATHRTRACAEVRGLVHTLPVSGSLWLVGFFALSGSPPFAPFVSELVILRAAFDGGRYAEGAAYLALLALVFVGMSTAVLGMSQGTPAGSPGAAGEPAPPAEPGTPTHGTSRSEVPHSRGSARSARPRATGEPAPPAESARGARPDARPGAIAEQATAVLPPLGLAALTLLFGVYIPEPLRALVEEAARDLGGPP